MDFRVGLADVRELVSKASVTTSSKDTMAVLKNFRVEVIDWDVDVVTPSGEVMDTLRQKRLRITGTDLELSYIGTVPCIGANGSFLVDAGKFSYILSKADGEDITVRKSGNKIEIEAGAAKHTLVVLAPDEYPEVKFYDYDDSTAVPFKIKRETFLENMRRVTHAICDEEIRANLMAVSLKQSQMVAADGRRLAIARFGTGEVEQDVDIPEPSVKSLTKLLGLLTPDSLAGTADDMMAVQRLDEYVHFVYGEDSFSIRASVTGFPNIQKQIDMTEKNDIEVMVDVDHLVRILKRVSINSDDTHSVKVEIEPTQIVLSTQDEIGNRSIEAISYESKKSFTSYFNLKHLLECLSVLERKSVELRFAEPKAGRAMPLRIDEDTYTEIILAEHGDF